MRYLRNRDRNSFVSTTGWIAVAGVAVGVAALVVVTSVMSGYAVQLGEMIVGLNAHGNVIRLTGGIDQYEQKLPKVAEVEGVAAVAPFVLREVMITSQAGTNGVLLKGIDPELSVKVSDLSKLIRPLEGEGAFPGRFEWLSDPEGLYEWVKENRKPEEKQEDSEDYDPQKNRLHNRAMESIILGSELAEDLKSGVGDVVSVVNPVGGGVGPTGPVPTSRFFRVAAIFHSGMYEYDLKFAFSTLKALQDFSQMEPDSITAIEFRVDDDLLMETATVAEAIEEKLGGFPYKVRDWREMNRNLFAALKLERIVMFIILTFITLVAAFNIASTLIMLVLEKIKEIAIFKSMGAKRTSIMGIFMIDGLLIGALGTVAGLLLGIILCALIPFLNQYLDLLDPKVYFMAKLPVRVEASNLAAIGVVAVTISWLATLFPALGAARLHPVKGLRND